MSRVGDLVGIKYFPAEPKKQQQEERIKLEWMQMILASTSAVASGNIGVGQQSWTKKL